MVRCHHGYVDGRTRLRFVIAGRGLVKLFAAVALIFGSADSLEAIPILLLKLIVLALIAVLITIIALSSYHGFIDDIEYLDITDTDALRWIQKLGMIRLQQL